MVSETKAVTPKDVATTKATQDTACRGRWSQCSGKFQQASESWHICHSCTDLREKEMKAGHTRPGTKGEKRTSAPKAPEPKGLSAAKAGKPTKVSKAAAEADDVPAQRRHLPPAPPRTPIARVVSKPAAPAAQA